MGLPDNIRVERAKNKLTQKSLAAALGVSESSVRKWESGNCEVSSSNVKRMALLFNCTSDYLLGIESKPA